MTEMERDFLDTYDEVFDEDGSIKACGRTKCKELINLASMIKPGSTYGDLESGFMDVENIQNLRNELS